MAGATQDNTPAAPQSGPPPKLRRQQNDYPVCDAAHLHRNTRSVRAALAEQSAFSSQFAPLLSSAIRDVLGSRSITSKYRHGSVAYIATTDVYNHFTGGAYRIPLNGHDCGFISFGQSLPWLFSDICFGLADPQQGEPHRARPTDIGQMPRVVRHLLSKIANRIAATWVNCWGQLFSCPATSAHWIGADHFHVGEMRQSYIQTQYQLECPGSLPEGAQPGADVLTLHMPTNALCEALFKRSAGNCGNDGEGLYDSGMGAALARVALCITAELTFKSLSLAHISAIKPGDIVPFEKPEEATLKVAGSPLFKASLGRDANRLVLQIIDSAVPGTSGNSV